MLAHSGLSTSGSSSGNGANNSLGVTGCGSWLFGGDQKQGKAEIVAVTREI
jgi:hypothetical protein